MMRKICEMESQYYENNEFKILRQNAKAMRRVETLAFSS